PARALVLADEAVERPLGDATLIAHQPRKDSVQLLGVLEVLGDDRGGIRVVDDPGPEEWVSVPLLAVEHVVDDAAEEDDVRTGTDRRIDIGDRTRASETRVDVNQFRAVVDLRLHGPTEGHRM